MKRDVQLFGLRIPSVLREKLGALAKKNERTITAEIIFRLEVNVEAEHQMMAGENGNTIEAIYAANAAIARHQQEIADWVNNLRKSQVDLKVSEEKPDYNAIVNMLPEADRQILDLAHGLSADARASLISLLKLTSVGTQKK